MNRIVILVGLILIGHISGAESPLYKYDFGEGKPIQGYTKVTTKSVYDSLVGFGFESTIGLSTHRDNNVKRIDGDYITADRPFYFSVKLPEGNYNVKVLAGDLTGTSLLTVKAENRRLMIEKVATKMGEIGTLNFTVHLRDSFIRSIPATKVKLKRREGNYLHWDNKLTLEFNNNAPKIRSIIIEKANGIPTIFLAGNSTVVDQANEPWAAWGQMFPAFLKPCIVSVGNYAESGETMKAFEGERRLEKIWSMAKPGDYLFIEFTHNDQKPGENHLDPFTTYKQMLKKWISLAKDRKITPVLVTSMHRRRFDSLGKVINTLGNYPNAIIETGEEENVTVLNLNAMSKAMYEAWGPERSIRAFVHHPANTFPDQKEELKDNTHFSSYGAYELAKCVVQAISESDLLIKKMIKDDFAAFDPQKPDLFEDFKLPASTSIESKTPDGN